MATFITLASHAALTESDVAYTWDSLLTINLHIIGAMVVVPYNCVWLQKDLNIKFEWSFGKVI